MVNIQHFLTLSPTTTMGGRKSLREEKRYPLGTSSQLNTFMKPTISFLQKTQPIDTNSTTMSPECKSFLDCFLYLLFDTEIGVFSDFLVRTQEKNICFPHVQMF